MPDERKGTVFTDKSVARDAEALGDRAVDKAQGVAKEQKAAGAERVEHIAEAMRSSAETLEGSEQQLADLVGTAAGQLEGLARSLREKDFPTLVNEMEDFGRRQPAVFMGAAVALGFGIARLAKAGSQAASSDHQSNRHGQVGQDTYRQPNMASQAERNRAGQNALSGSISHAPNRSVGLHETGTGFDPAHRPGTRS